MKQCLLSISANALRKCMLFNNSEISFERIHYVCKKCTPKQITLYQISLKLPKTINEMDQGRTFEHVTILRRRCKMRERSVYLIHIL